MTTSRPRRGIVPARRALPVAALLAALAAQPGCTDLSEEPFSVITPNKFYQNDAQAARRTSAFAAVSYVHSYRLNEFGCSRPAAANGANRMSPALLRW